MKTFDTKIKCGIREIIYSFFIEFIHHGGRRRETLHIYTLPAEQWILEQQLFYISKKYPEKNFVLHCFEYESALYNANNVWIFPSVNRTPHQLSNNFQVSYELGDFVIKAVAPSFGRSFVWADYCGAISPSRLSHLRQFSVVGNMVFSTFALKRGLPQEMLVLDVKTTRGYNKPAANVLIRSNNAHNLVQAVLQQGAVNRVTSISSVVYKQPTDSNKGLHMYTGGFLIT